MKDKPNLEAIPNYRIYGDFEKDFSVDPIYVDDIQQSSTKNHGRIHLHRHDDLVHLILIQDGHGEMQLGEQRYQFDRTSLIIIPPGEVHSFKVEDNIKGLLITLAPHILVKFIPVSEEYLSLMEQACFLEHSEIQPFYSSLEALFGGMKGEYNRREQGYALALLSQIGQLLVAVLRIKQWQSRTELVQTQEEKNLWFYRQYQTLVSQHFFEHKSVTDYAVQLRISTTHLNRVCRFVANKSALQVIHDRIMHEAKINLTYTFSSISDIAYKLGFEDVSYFSRFFKRQVGVSPKDFIKERAKAD